MATFASLTELENTDQYKCDILFVDVGLLGQENDSSGKLEAYKAFCNNITIGFSNFQLNT